MPTLSEFASADYESLYLCIGCHQPLYTQLQSQLDFCINPQCSRWPAEYSSVVDAHEQHEPGVYLELDEQKNRILEIIRSCNLSSLRRFAHDRRGSQARTFLETRVMVISDWHAVAELLVLTQSETSTGGEESQEVFAAILRETSAWATRMRFMEDLRTGRYGMMKL